MGIEPVSPDSFAGSVVIPLDYRVSDSNAMLTRDLVPTVDMRTLCLKSHHICNVITTEPAIGRHGFDSRWGCSDIFLNTQA